MGGAQGWQGEAVASSEEGTGITSAWEGSDSEEVGLLIFWHWRLGRDSISCGPKLPRCLAFLGECGVIPYWSQNVPHQPLGGAATDILFAQVKRRFLSTARKAQLRETVDKVQRGA